MEAEPQCGGGARHGGETAAGAQAAEETAASNTPFWGVGKWERAGRVGGPQEGVEGGCVDRVIRESERRMCGEGKERQWKEIVWKGNGETVEGGILDDFVL